MIALGLVHSVEELQGSFARTGLSQFNLCDRSLLRFCCEGPEALRTDLDNALSYLKACWEVAMI